MLLANRPLWRRVSWPVLVITTFFLVWYPHGDQAYRAWASSQTIEADHLEAGAWELAYGNKAVSAKAAELGHEPARVFAYVRNEIAYEPTYALVHGPEVTIARGRGNAVEQSVLLAALLRQCWRARGLMDGTNDVSLQLQFRVGDIRLSARQARELLGVSTRAAVQSLLTGGNVPHSFNGVGEESFQLILEDHPWVRARLATGNLRGSEPHLRGEQVWLELDPAVVVSEDATQDLTYRDVTGVDALPLTQALLAATTTGADSSIISEIPLETMLQAADGGALLFRTLLLEEGLSVEHALTNRKPTHEGRGALPEALPYELVTRPASYDHSAAAGAAFLDGYRAVATVAISDGDGDALSLAGQPGTHTISVPLTRFASSGLRFSREETDGTLRVDAGALPAFFTTTSVGDPLLAGIEVSYPTEFVTTPPPSEPPYRRASLDVEFASGDILAVALAPSIYAANADEVTRRLDELRDTGDEHTPAEKACEAVATAAAVHLSQNIELQRIAGLAAEMEVYAEGEWAAVRLVDASAGLASSTVPMELVFLQPQGAVLARPRTPIALEAGAREYLQLVREAVTARTPSSFDPDKEAGATSAGPLFLSAAKGDLGILGVGEDDASPSALLPGGSFVPQALAGLSMTLATEADLSGWRHLLPEYTPPADPTAGAPWGLLTRREVAGQAVWFSRWYDSAGEEVLGRIPVAASTDAHALLGAAASGVRRAIEVRTGTSQALIAASEPCSILLNGFSIPPGSSQPAVSTAEFADRAANAVVFVNLVFDEFSKSYIRGATLLDMTFPSLPTDPPQPPRVVPIGGSVNVDGDGARIDVQFSRSIDDSTSGDDVDLVIRKGSTVLSPGTHYTTEFDSENEPDTIKVILPGDGVLAGYNGPLTIQPTGTLGGLPVRRETIEFIIDTQAPDVDLHTGHLRMGGDGIPVVTGTASILGTAEDDHFARWTLEEATEDSSTGQVSGFTALKSSTAPALGLATLARIESGAPSAPLNGVRHYRLVALDEAGNTAESDAEEIRFDNDVIAPTIAWQPDARPTASPITASTQPQVTDGMLRFALEAEDRRHPDTGGDVPLPPAPPNGELVSFDAHVEYYHRTLQGNTGFQPVLRTKPLFEWREGPDEGATATDARTLRLSDLQAWPNSPVRVIATARDSHGNETRFVDELTLDLDVFQSRLDQAVIYNTPIVATKPVVHVARLKVFHKPELDLQIQIEGGAPPLSPSRTHFTPAMATSVDGEDLTGYSVFEWNATGAAVLESGYDLVLTDGSGPELARHKVTVIAGEGDPLVGHLSTPLFSIVPKNKPLPSYTPDPAVEGQPSVQLTQDGFLGSVLLFAQEEPDDPLLPESSFVEELPLQPLNVGEEELTHLLRDHEPGVVPIWGYVKAQTLETVPEAIAMAPGTPQPLAQAPEPLSPDDELPITLPASRPYWMLSYKPSSLPPLVPEGGDIGEEFFKSNANYLHEPNWKVINYGFTNIYQCTPVAAGAPHPPVDGPGYLADWDVRSIPSGQYDLRLVVADGANLYSTTVIPRLNVVHTAASPGEDDSLRTPGVMTLSQTDFSSSLAGFPIEVRRDYNSARAYEIGDFGRGWTLDSLGGGMKIVTEEHTSYSTQLELEITLPDGRAFTYRNRPSEQAFNSETLTAWIKERAFISRPYGQMLWIPEHVSPAEVDSVLGGSGVNSSDGALLLSALGLRTVGSPTEIVLQIEDGTLLVYDWETGRLLHQVKGSPIGLDSSTGLLLGARHVNHSLGGQALASDGKSLQVTRNDLGMISSISDPAGRRYEYTYDGEQRLRRVKHPNGELRHFLYTDLDFPYHLTAMVIDAHPYSVGLVEEGQIGAEDTRVDYEYDESGRLQVIDAGPSEIAMEYDSNSDGTGSQAVVDAATGARTTVEYDDAGRVTRQVDPLGVVTAYEYFSEEDSEGSFVTKPAGALESETVAGIRTDYAYDLDPYAEKYTGYEGIAQRLIDSWLYNYSDGSAQNDYNGTDLKIGYYTSRQVQPSQIVTQAIQTPSPLDGSGGLPSDTQNSVGVTYSHNASESASGLVLAVSDPEGRGVNLSYIDGGVANQEVRIIDSAGAVVTNEYLDATEVGTTWNTSHFLGRLRQTVSAPKVNAGGIETVFGPGTQTSYDFLQLGSVSAWPTEGPPPLTGDPFAVPDVRQALASIATVFADTPPNAEGVYPPDSMPARFSAHLQGLWQGAFDPDEWNSDLWLEVVVTEVWEDPTPLSEQGDDLVHVPVLSGEAFVSRSLEVRDAMGNSLASWDDGTGAWRLSFYDARDRLVLSLNTVPDGEAYDLESWSSTRYDHLDNVVETTSARLVEGQWHESTTTHAHDSFGRLLQTTYPDGGIASVVYGDPRDDGARERVDIDPDGNRTVTVTDMAGRVVEERWEGVEGAVRVTRHSYDEHGRRLRTSSPRGLVTEVAYDSAGREVSTTTRWQGDEQTVNKGYDRHDRVIWTQTPEQEDAGKFTTYAYFVDRPSNMLASVYLDVQTTGISPVTDPRYGQLLLVVHEDNNHDAYNNLSTPAPGVDFTFVPDSGQAPPLPYYELYAYDEKGRRIAETKPTSTGFGVAVSTETTRTFHDEDGRAQFVVFNWDGTFTPAPGGAPYDLGEGVTDENITFEFLYNDETGARESVIYPSGLAKQWLADADGDPYDYLETQVGTPGAQQTWRKSFRDEQGRTSKTETATAEWLSFYEDEESYRPVADVARFIGGGDAGLTSLYQHDSRGRLSGIEQHLVAALSQPEEEEPTLDLGSLGDQTLSRTESFTYDAQTGRIASATKREGAIDYAYDDHGALASMSFLGRTVAYGYDAHGRLSHVQAPDGEWRYEYDSSGRKKSVENVAAGLLETWDHDELGRLRSITHVDTAKSPEDEGHVIYEAEYVFGPDGRRVAMVERRASNEASETLWQYEYDGLGRLVAEMAGTRTRGSGAEPAAWSRNVRYTYDVDSNRTSEQRLHAAPVEEDSYVHDTGSQRLLSINHLEGGVHARTTLFEYSLAGELTSKQVRRASDNGLLSAEDYTWSPKGEMESALVDHDGDGDDVVSVLYSYDDRGTLVERTSYLVADGPASAVTERYLVDYENPTGYSQVLAEWRQVGSDAEFVLARLYSYGDDLRAETTLVAAEGSTGAGGGGPPAHALVPGVQFPLRDALGTVRASAGFASGLTPGEASINDYRYSAFGLPLGENFAPADASTRGSLTSQSAPSPWAFTGQRIDPATGLQYHRARWLDMALGRWASVDPVWDWPGNAGSGYGYGQIATLNANDTSGAFSNVELLAINSIISGLVNASLTVLGNPNASESDILLSFGFGAVSGLVGGVAVGAVWRFFAARVIIGFLGFVGSLVTLWAAKDAKTVEEGLFLTLLGLLGIFSSGTLVAKTLGPLTRSTGPTASQVISGAAKGDPVIPRVLANARIRVFTKVSEFRSPTGRTYQVFQRIRSDVHPDYVSPDARLNPSGLSNRARAAKGQSVITSEGDIVELHHINQDPRGPLVEVRARVHDDLTSRLHPYSSSFGTSGAPTRGQFDRDRFHYWKQYARERGW